MNNLRLYKNNCLKDVISGIQIPKGHTSCVCGKQLSGASDIGKRKKNQEDSYIILEHPDNKDFKLLAVSDGVGGKQNGEIASSTVIKNLSLWFEGLDPRLMSNLDVVQNELSKMLPNILREMSPLSGSATLAAAIVGEKDTLIVNIGDSRVYTWKRGFLEKQTRDDSLVQKMCDMKIIPSEELMRFHKKSNIITGAISTDSNDICPNFKIIDNISYDRIYAFTDGVTDSLSKKDLKRIIKKSRGNASNQIVISALENISDLEAETEKLSEEEKERAYELIEFMDENYHQEIPGGKDNITAVEYRKK